MRGMRGRALLAVIAVVLFGPQGAGTADSDAAEPPAARHELCGEADHLETGMQGDVPRTDQESGEAEQGYNCGLTLVGHTDLDQHGRNTSNANMAWVGDCAYVAGSSEAFGAATPDPARGIAVVDVSDPAHPQHIKTLTADASTMVLETIHAVETDDGAILVAGQYGNQSGGDKPMDIYDVSDCTDPKLVMTYRWPENIHNLTISGNGRYVFATQPLQVLDIGPLFDDEPETTEPIYLGNLEDATDYPIVGFGPVADADDAVPAARQKGGYMAHEAWPTHDGTKLYMGGQLPVFEVFTILDITQWLTRDANNEPAGPPEVISQRGGRGHSVRTATIRDEEHGLRRFALHSEESVFGQAYGCVPEALNPFAGAAQAWLSDITDEANPVMRVSQLTLEINQPENCGAQFDSGTQASAHYNDVDEQGGTTFAMLPMMNAGLRLFDIRTPEAPNEVAYFNPGDVDDGDDVNLDRAWAHVRYVPETGHIWLSTASGGFWILELQAQVRQYLGLD